MSSAADIARTREGRSNVRAAIARLSQYVRRNNRYYAVWTVITLAYVACFVVIPMLLGRAIDAIGVESQAQLAERGLWIAGVALLAGALRYFSRTLVFNAGRQIEYEIRNDLFAQGCSTWCRRPSCSWWS
jgi:ATP-binding cassette subfamily B protein